MEITVEFRRGQWKVLPDPAVVARNELVQWVVVADILPVQRLRWTIYFRQFPPELFVPWPNGGLRVQPQFGPEAIIRTTTLSMGFGSLPTSERPEPVVNHQGITEPIAVGDPGDYKYGIRVENPENNEVLGDEDPLLIVR